MKNLILLVSLFSATAYSGGGFQFPTLQYSYAKLYLFNINQVDDQMPEFSIHRNGVYSKSKLGNGYELPDESLVKISELMAQGVDELLTGLSSCYLPRHGIIYFNELNEPVASLSICFECDRISVWQDGMTYEPKVDEKKFNTTKAEGQITQLEEIIRKTDVPVFDKPEDYFDAIKKDSALYIVNGTMHFDFTESSPAEWKFDFLSVKTWRHPYSAYSRYVDEVDVKYTYGGDEYKFRKWSGSTGTWFLFDSESDSSTLSEAFINDPDILLPWGISVGMSLEQVQNSFMVWDGISDPEFITVKNGILEIEYKFERRTLMSITIRNY